MRKLVQASLLIALLSGVVSAQQVVMDTRKFYDPIDLSENQQSRILRETRSRDHLRPCDGGEVRDEITGSFTRAGAKQVAYLVMNCQTFAAEPMRNEFGRLVVYEAGKIVHTVKNIGDRIGNVGDINKDGIDDLLFLTYFGPHMGHFSANASVVTVAGGKFRTFLDLSDAMLDTCDTGAADRGSWAHRLTVQKGPRPLFTDTVYRADCRTPETYKAGLQRKIWSDVK